MKELISTNTKYHQNSILYIKEVYKENGRIIKSYSQSQISFDDFSDHFKKYKLITGLDCRWYQDQNNIVFDVIEIDRIDIPPTVLETLKIITDIRELLSKMLPELDSLGLVVNDILFQNIGRYNDKLFFIDESKFKEDTQIEKQLIYFALGAWRMIELTGYNSDDSVFPALEHINKEIYTLRLDLERFKI